MNVIPFPEWRVYFYLDDEGRNAIRVWLEAHEIGPVDRWPLQGLIDFIEMAGPDMVGSSIVDLGDGIYGLSSARKGGTPICLLFCHGPVGETEITVLAAAEIDGKRLRPKYAKGIAEEHLENLKRDSKRKRREPIT